MRRAEFIKFPLCHNPKPKVTSKSANTMMEPLSIVVSAFGLTTGVINILLGTITAIEQRSREFREHSERLRDYKRRLALVEISIEAWKATWGGFSNTTYRYFWTQEGFDEIQQWRRDLTRLITDLNRNFYRGTIGPYASF
jgi:hypothetical protein